jgi:hypothetical protein
MGILGHTLLKMLLGGSIQRDRTSRLAVLGVGVGTLMLESVLIVQNGWIPIREWPPGPFAGLMAATVWAIVPFAFGAVSLLRVSADKPLAAACAITGATTLLMTLYLSRL